jgi:hypothetical protein
MENFKNILLLVAAIFCNPAMAEIRLGIYADSKCTKYISTIENSIKTLNPQSSCNITSYIDPVTSQTRYTSFSDFQCTPDGIIVTKHPMQEGCEGSRAVSNYIVSATACRAAPSHLGTVYEKLIEYYYPGNKDCKGPK